MDILLAERVDTAPIDLDRAIQLFLLHHAGGLSSSYEVWLRRRLAHLAQYLGQDRLIASITIVDLDAWYSLVLQQGTWGDEYKRGYGVAVKTFFTWLGKRRYLSSNPASLLTPKHINQGPPKAISDETAAALLAAAGSSARDYAVVLFLLRTGVRKHEATGLLRSRLSLGERWAIVTGKGKRGAKQQRTVIFDSATAAALRGWLDVAPPSLWLFCARDGQQLQPDALRLLLNRLVKKAGIVEEVSPHRLRHYFGVTAAALGASEAFIQQQLGHADPKTTQRYTRFAPYRLREAYDRVFHDRGIHKP